MNKEPAIIIGAITGIIMAILALAASFGFSFTKDQVAAILGLFATIGPILVGLHIRGYVSPAADTSPIIAIPPAPAASPVDRAIPTNTLAASRVDPR